MTLEEEGAENGGSYNQKDTGEEPACGRLAGVGVATAELAVGFDTAYKPQYRTNRITQFGGGIEIRGHHAGRFIDTCKALSLRECACHGKHA